MFGRRDASTPAVINTPTVADKPAETMPTDNTGLAPQAKATKPDDINQQKLDAARSRVATDLREGIDLKTLARMDVEAARAEIAVAVQEIARFIRVYSYLLKIYSAFTCFDRSIYTAIGSGCTGRRRLRRLRYSERRILWYSRRRCL